MKPVFTVPCCQHPQLILNRAALSLMKCAGCSLSTPQIWVSNPFSAVSQKILLQLGKGVVRDGGFDGLQEYYVTLGEDRFEYLFIVVRCGKCPVCSHSKQIDLINRVQMESSCYSSPCYMITLTYDEKHLPCHRAECRHRGVLKNSLYYPDVQNFFKRLRIRWSRAGLSHDIRYLVAGEYGSRHSRPHYHILLWNNPYHCGEFSPLDVKCRINHKKLVDDVFFAWNMCSRDAFQCEPAGDGAAGYVSKYITKQSLYRFKKGCGIAAPFIRASNRHGGIGAPAVLQHAAYYKRNPQLQDFTYRSFDGDVVKVPMCAFIKNKLYPSASRQISAKYKRAFVSLVDCSLYALDYNLITRSEIQDTLDYYRLGVLFYQLPNRDLLVHQHDPLECDDGLIDDVVRFCRDRIAVCYDALLDELDALMPLEFVDCHNQHVHRLHQVVSENKDVQQRTSVVKDALFLSLSKEVL